MINCDGLYNKDYFGNQLYENHFYDKKLHFRIIENGTILPHKALSGDWNWGFGGIVDEKNNYIKSSFLKSNVGGAYTPNEDIAYSPETVIYLGMFFYVWGHCITDNLKRIWFLQSDVYKKYLKKYPLVCLPMKGVEPNFLKVLQILDVDTSQLRQILRPTKFQNIILPDESFFYDSESETIFFTAEYRETIERIRNYAQKNFTPLEDKKYYFFHGIHQIGEERLAKYFESKGYKIILPGKLDLETELNILANCESFASTLGSCAHNMIFIKENSQVIFIPRSCYLTACQNALNNLRDMEITYIDSTLSLFQPRNGGPFCYIISDRLKKFFSDECTGEYSDEDFVTFLNYVKYSLTKKKKMPEETQKYYAPILPDFKAQLKSRTDLLEKFGVTLK